MRNALVGFVAMAIVGTLPVVASAAGKPDATLKLSSGSVGVGVGFSWGSGTLTYKGKRYKVKVDGFTVGSVGASSAEAVGSVYHLKKVGDINGIYTAIGASGTVGGGAGAMSMRNASGVVINLHSTTKGLKVSAGPSGVTLTLEQ